MNPSSRVIIATHELYYGAPQALRDYLVRQLVKELVYVSHPIRSENKQSNSIQYKSGKLLQTLSFTRPSGKVIWFVVDFITTIIWIIRKHKKYDVYIGIDPLNCMVGLVLRVLGLVRCVIFYSIDFTPKRFSQKILNFLYHSIERFCVRYSDIRWDISPRIAEGREKFLGIIRTDFPVTVVPVGIWEKNIVPNNHVYNFHRIAFVGHLLKKQGVDKVLEALAIISKNVKDVTFLIIGGGEEEKSLRQLTIKLQLEENVEFTGWIWDQNRIQNLISGCAFAVATYDPQGATEDNFTYYADPTKIKTYLSGGLPVIMTNVPYNSQELKRLGCAEIVAYSASSIAKAMTIWLGDKKKLDGARKKALDVARSFTWEKIFGSVTGFSI